MEALIKQVVDTSPSAPVMVIFGGNPYRMNEVITMLKQHGGITAHGAFSAAEGLNLLKNTPQAALVLIGGRYSMAEREEIRNYIAANRPTVKITEPGHDYPYDNKLILQDIKDKLGVN
jgi:hypothetical protein